MAIVVKKYTCWFFTRSPLWRDGMYKLEDGIACDDFKEAIEKAHVELANGGYTLPVSALLIWPTTGDSHEFTIYPQITIK